MFAFYHILSRINPASLISRAKLPTIRIVRRTLRDIIWPGINGLKRNATARSIINVASAMTVSVMDSDCQTINTAKNVIIDAMAIAGLFIL